MTLTISPIRLDVNPKSEVKHWGEVDNSSFRE